MAACWAPRKPKGSACTEPGHGLAQDQHQSRLQAHHQLKAPAHFTAGDASGASRSHPHGSPSIDTGGEPCAQAPQPAHQRSTDPRTPSPRTYREADTFALSKILKKLQQAAQPFGGSIIPPICSLSSSALMLSIL
eukprot:scaffold6922_cov237-Isochrysis_galbana.AAC.1